MIGVFKNVSLAWINKVAVIGYTWLFVSHRAHSHEEGLHVPPVHDTLTKQKQPIGCDERWVAITHYRFYKRMFITFYYGSLVSA